MLKSFLPLLLCFSLASLSAQENATLVTAKLLKVLSASSGFGGSIACQNPEVVAELAKVGVKVDAGAPLVWVDEKSKLKPAKAGVMQVVPKVEWLDDGGCVAIVLEVGKKPSIFIHLGNLDKSGQKANVPDSIMKIAQKL